MKKNILGLILAIIVSVPSGRVFASDTSYGDWFRMASTMAGGLPALYTLFSKIKSLYFDYVHSELVDIQNMTGGLSLLYSLFTGADRKLSSLVKTSSLDEQLTIAANQLYERLTDQKASINDAIDLLQTLITGKPKATFDMYKDRLGIIADAETEMRVKIEYYMARILEKIKLNHRLNPSGGEEIGLKQSLLDIIYRELRSRDPKLPVLEEINKMLDELEKQWQEEMLPGSKLAVKKENKTITFANYIGVPKEARDFVEQIKDPKIAEAMGVSLPGGILLTGDPGTGKTHLARAIAGELDCPFFAYAATDLAGFSYTAAVIRYVFRVAREEAEKEGKKMAIIFIDEFDAIGSRTGENVGKTTAQSVIALLTQLDGFEQQKVKVIVIAATNHPDRIDSALTRSGRIETIVHIGYPDKEARKKFLEESLQNKPINENVPRNAFIEKLADVTDGLSPVDIRLFVDNAARMAIAQKKGETSIDYDCIARSLWNMKQEKYKKQLPTKADKERLLSSLILEYRVNIKMNAIWGYVDNMDLLDIMEVFEKANKFAQEKPGKNFKEWLDVAVRAQNNLLHIKQNREIIHLCEKIYDPMKVDEYSYPEGPITRLTPEQQFALSVLQSDDIFKGFERKYAKDAKTYAKAEEYESMKSEISSFLSRQNIKREQTQEPSTEHESMKSEISSFLSRMKGKQEQVQKSEKVEPENEEKQTKVVIEEVQSN